MVPQTRTEINPYLPERWDNYGLAGRLSPREKRSTASLGALRASSGRVQSVLNLNQSRQLDPTSLSPQVPSAVAPTRATRVTPSGMLSLPSNHR